jgi:hypothetical protein
MTEPTGIGPLNNPLLLDTEPFDRTVQARNLRGDRVGEIPPPPYDRPDGASSVDVDALGAARRRSRGRSRQHEKPGHEAACGCS